VEASLLAAAQDAKKNMLGKCKKGEKKENKEKGEWYRFMCVGSRLKRSCVSSFMIAYPSPQRGGTDGFAES